MQIIVLGTHRSGTSMVTRLINMMGAYFASEQTSIGFSEENPKGFWERRDVIEANDALLALKDCTWDETEGWEPEKLDVPQELEKTLKTIVLDLDAHRPWVVKDPRLCLTFSYWKPYLEIPAAVLVARDPLEVAKSLQTRNGMSLAEGIALWEYYTVGMLGAAADLPKFWVEHGALIADPVKATKQIYEGLKKIGVQSLRLPSEQEVLAFVEPKYYRSRIELRHEEILNLQQLKLMKIIRDGGGGKDFKISAGGREAVCAYIARKRQEVKLKQSEECQGTLQAQIEQMNKEKQEMVERYEQLEERLRQAQSEIERLANDAQALRHAIEALRGSTSWKLGNGIISTVKKVVGK